MAPEEAARPRALRSDCIRPRGRGSVPGNMDFGFQQVASPDPGPPRPGDLGSERDGGVGRQAAGPVLPAFHLPAFPRTASI